MRVGFFTVFRTDPQHFLHAASLAVDVRAVMPGVELEQLTDERTPLVPGVTSVRRKTAGPMLERRLEQYADCEGEWLLVDTDVSIRKDVRHVFDDPVFDVALTDRQWPHLPQGEDLLQEMPFNTGVVFSRSTAFWTDVLSVWRGYSETQRDWLSEQRAVNAVVRTGKYRVKILPGQTFNYPPASEHDTNPEPAIWHYKGPNRKMWLSTRAYQALARTREDVCV